MGVFSPGFRGRSVETNAALPPGQHETRDFPVLSAGPTPRVPPVSSPGMETVTCARSDRENSATSAVAAGTPGSSVRCSLITARSGG